MHAGITQNLADHSLVIMDALFAPFDEAAFPRQLSVPQLTKLLESPLAMRVLCHHQHIKVYISCIQTFLFDRLLLQPLCWLQP